MFYSTDLLKRKTPLGSVWIAAHGSRLTRGQIMEINIPQTCNDIIDPSVPHALRLQAILASGVARVFSKQSTFLLEDTSKCLARLGEIDDHSKQNRKRKGGRGGLENVINFTFENGILVPKNLDDINLRDDVIIDASVFAPAAFTDSHLPRKAIRTQADEDIFFMPSIPDINTTNTTNTVDITNTAKRNKTSGAGVKGNAIEFEEYFVVGGRDEVMEAPDLPDTFFDFNNNPMNADGALYDLGFQFIDTFPEPEHGVTGKFTEKAQGDTIADKRKKRTVRHKKAFIDSPDHLTIGEEGYIMCSQDWNEFIGRNGNVLGRTGHVDLFSLGPATGPWPEELAYIWERCNTAAKASVLAVTTPAGAVERASGVRKNGKRKKKEEDQGAEKHDSLFLMESNDKDRNNVDFYPPPPMDEYYNYFLDAGADIGFGAPPSGLRNTTTHYHSDNIGSGDFEAERLRAALNGTPGDDKDYRSALFQLGLGLTPASEDKSNHGGRFSSGTYRRDSNRGRLSERISEPGSNRLSDLLEEMQAVGNMMGDALPTVEEGDPIPSINPTQYSMLIETEADDPINRTQRKSTRPISSTAEQHIHTLHVLSSLRSLTLTNKLVLSQAIVGLSRLEAAQVFSHVLVGRSKGFIGVEQHRAYGDITITFFSD